MYKIAAVLIIVAIPIFFFFSEGTIPGLSFFGNNKGMPLVFFADQVPLRVSVADSPDERTQGLSGRPGLEPTEGLLFIYEDSDYHGIWMKDMLFPIDIIWIDEDFRVVHIESNVYPDTYPKIFEPVRPARFIIETNGNYAESFKVKVGDTVTLPKDLIPEDLQ